jgi:cell division protein FtsL
MKKKKTGIIKRNRYVFIFVVIFSIYVAVTLVRQEVQYRSLKAEEETYLKEIDSLNIEIAKLEKELESNKDLKSIEKIAREKLKMVKPNEIIYIIQENE